jgi:hypothetical protein
MKWPDRLAVVSVVYYCVCGLVVLGLDAMSGVHTGKFTIVSPHSLIAVKWLAPAGVVLSAIAFVGRPDSRTLGIAATLVCIMFALAGTLAWVLYPG